MGGFSGEEITAEFLVFPCCSFVRAGCGESAEFAQELDPVLGEPALAVVFLLQRKHGRPPTVPGIARLVIRRTKENRCGDTAACTAN